MNNLHSSVRNDPRQGTGDWPGLEAAALGSGAVLPLFHRHAWDQIQPEGSTLRVPVTDPSGELLSIVVLQKDRSRILPGHYFLRLPRFGYGWPRDTWAPIIDTLTALARKDSRVLRLSIEVFLRDGKTELREILKRSGFQQVPPRSYRHTLTMAVNEPDEAILATRKSLRKRLKEVEKIGAPVLALTDQQFAPRLIELQQAAMLRSGGAFRIQDWPALLRLSKEHPELSRIVGLFPSADATQPSDMLGFAWGCMHGDHAEYRAAGTAQLTGAIHRLPVSYPLLWDLLRWARESGASWFDLGGVTVDEGQEDPLAGISAFKSTFSQTLEEVGEEWMLEPHPLRSAVARRLGKTLSDVKAILRGEEPSQQ
jgi:hypothetical protein